MFKVGSEMLPASTERTVTVSGGSDAITQCIYNICNIMAEVIITTIMMILIIEKIRITAV